MRFQNVQCDQCCDYFVIVRFCVLEALLRLTKTEASKRAIPFSKAGKKVNYCFIFWMLIAHLLGCVCARGNAAHFFFGRETLLGSAFVNLENKGPKWLISKINITSTLDSARFDKIGWQNQVLQMIKVAEPFFPSSSLAPPTTQRFLQSCKQGI